MMSGFEFWLRVGELTTVLCYQHRVCWDRGGVEWRLVYWSPKPKQKQEVVLESPLGEPCSRTPLSIEEEGLLKWFTHLALRPADRSSYSFFIRFVSIYFVHCGRCKGYRHEGVLIHSTNIYWGPRRLDIMEKLTFHGGETDNKSISTYGLKIISNELINV